MKGQYLTLENVFFFATGVLLMLLIYTTFSSISEIVKQEVTEKQMQKTADFIHNAIIKTYTYGNFTDSSILFITEIPNNIIGCEYMISISDNKLHISCLSNNIKKSVSLYGIESAGRIYSNAGILKINYTNNKITLS